MEYTKQELSAVNFYQGCGVFTERDPFYRQNSAYESLNLLMMPGQDGERVRVCIEKQTPNSLCIIRWEKTLEVLCDLFTVLCKYASDRAAQGLPLPDPLERGDRGVNFRLMCQNGGTIAFTSTSKEVVLDEFVVRKQEPHVLHITLGGKVPYLDFEEFLREKYSFSDEREVLLPPMVAMTCGKCEVREHPVIGPIRHYWITLDGFRPDGELQDEQALTEILNAHAYRAAEGLQDLVGRRLDADILREEDHPYWIWKAAFRRLVLQRMQAIYGQYFTE